MKPSILKNLLAITFFSFAILLTGSCESRQRKDEIVKADLVTKAKKEKAFSGVRFTVVNGVVTLSGICPTEKAKSKVETTVKGVYAVEKVVNNITVGPVVIGTDEQLRESVDSVLKKYPAVDAIVADSAVVLAGSVPTAKAQALVSAIEQLKPKRVENNLIIQ